MISDPWPSHLTCFCVFRFVNLLLSQMSMEELREEACDCLFEIVNKGMDPVDKTKLVESLCQVLQSAGFFNVEQVRVTMDTRNTPITATEAHEGPENV